VVAFAFDISAFFTGLTLWEKPNSTNPPANLHDIISFPVVAGAHSVKAISKFHG
jgi:hypothetical protein